MTQVLITGGAGFIGLHLARRLRREGWAVELADNFSRGQRDPDLEEVCRDDGVRLHDGDLRDPAFIDHLGREYDFIFHLAAILGVQNVIDRPYDVLDVNVALTVNTIELARRQSRLRRLVFASTSEVYAGTIEIFNAAIPTPESTPIALPPIDRPRSSYMLSKIYGEALCLHSGCAVTIIRPHNVYGPRMGMSHVIPQLLDRGHRLPEGGILDVFSLDHTRTFCFVDDAVEMIFRLANSDAAVGRVVNVGTQAPEVSIGKLAQIVIATLGKRLVVSGKLPTQGSPVRRAPEMLLCEQLTGYRSKVLLERGVAETYAWYRSRIS